MYNIDINDIYSRTRGGLDIILKYYPQAAKCVEKRNESFKIRPEKDGSAYLKRLASGVWIVTDFGDDFKGKNAVQIVQQHEPGIKSFYEALVFISNRILGSDYIPKFAYEPIFVDEPKSKEAENTYNFKLKKFIKTELNILGTGITQEHCDFMNLESVLEYTWTGYSKKHNALKTYTFKSTDENPVFLFDYGDFKKLYRPLAPEKKDRFFWIGQVPEGFIGGMQQLEKAVKDGRPVEFIFICTGERDSLNVYANAPKGSYPVFQMSESAEFTMTIYKRLAAICPNIYSIPDIDAAGIKKGIELAVNFLSLKTVWLPLKMRSFKDFRGNECKDICDFFRYWVKDKNKKIFLTLNSGECDKKLKEANEQEFAALIKKAKKLQFWRELKQKDKTKKFIFKPTRAYSFLKATKFYRIEDKLSDEGFSFVRIQNNIVEKVKTQDIRDFVHHHLKEKGYSESLLDNFYSADRRFSEKSLSNLDYCHPDFITSGSDFQYMFFENQVWRITAKEIQMQQYGKIAKSIWRDKIRDFKVQLEKPMFEVRKIDDDFEIKFAENHGCDVFQYLIDTSEVHWNVKQKTKDQVSEERKHLLNKITALGYLLHTYKSQDRPWGVFSMDNRISLIGESYGGNGKSIFGKICQQVLKTEYKNGRNTKLLDNQFIWHGVDETTDMIFLDDVHQYFRFDYFFPLLTGDMDVNPKNGRPYVLPFNVSPKFYFASNHALNNIDGSTARRVFYIVFSDYYHPKDPDGFYEREWNPALKFKKNFFSSAWLPDDWNKFYNLLALCVQTYLKYGKIDPPMRNVEKRNRLQEMGNAFFDWARKFFSDDTKLNNRVNRQEMVNLCKLSLTTREANAMTPQKFRKKLIAFCKYFDLEFNPTDQINTKDGRIIDGTDEFFYIAGTITEVDEDAQPTESIPDIDSDTDTEFSYEGKREKAPF